MRSDNATGHPFDQTLFGKLPEKLRHKIFLKLSVNDPHLVITKDNATQAQKNAVIAGEAYQVIRAVDREGSYTYSLGFAKKSSEGALTYNTEPLKKDNFFYDLLIQTPTRLDSMADPSAPRDTYAFYFLKEALRQAGGADVSLQTMSYMKRAHKKLNEQSDIQKRMREIKVELALRYVLFGNQAMVKKLVEADPSLLLDKNTSPVTDISGKPVLGQTLLQAAFASGDIANNPGEINMVEMLQGYFTELSDGPKKIEEQLIEFFTRILKKEKISSEIIEKLFQTGPPVITLHTKLIEVQKEKAEQFKNEFISPLIDAMIRATNEEIQEMLTNKQMAPPLGQAFHNFRKEIERLSFEDEAFNPYYLLEAFTLYTERFNNPQFFPRNLLFCVQGIGFIQRFLPACYQQAFAQGICYIVEEKEPLNRDYKLRCAKNYALYSIPRGPFFHSASRRYVNNVVLSLVLSPVSFLSGLGFDYWIDASGQLNRNRPANMTGIVSFDATIPRFCQTKVSGLSNLLCRTPRAQSRAVL